MVNFLTVEDFLQLAAGIFKALKISVKPTRDGEKKGSEILGTSIGVGLSWGRNGMFVSGPEGKRQEFLEHG